MTDLPGNEAHREWAPERIRRLGGDRELNISDPRTAEAKAKYNFRAQPYFVLLDSEGEVVNTWQGYTDKAFFDEQFGSVLGQ